MNQTLFDEFEEPVAPGFPGFRLSKLEVFNWGTFDGVVHGINPRGESILLVGQNGTGKSTLVDALLTLLVRPNTRNYNVAAGATKTERDERTYIQGAYDKRVSSDGSPKIEYLRPGNRHYSALLACFENSRTGRIFTICQVLYLDSNSKPKKLYALDDTKERGIVDDLGSLGDGTAIITALKDRGFQATDSYTRYFAWIRRITGFRAKAMDMFNQAAWVKDVQKLDSFVRDHMLEKKPWNDKVSQLLKHFAELSETHRMLVRVREQRDTLQPIIEHGSRFKVASERLGNARAQLEASSLYFKTATLDLLQPLCEEWRTNIADLDKKITAADEELSRDQREIARLEVEIESSGGQRLRDLAQSIERHEELEQIRHDQRISFQGLLNSAGITIEVTTEEHHRSALANAEIRDAELQAEKADAQGKLKSLQYEIGQQRLDLGRDVEELEALKKRKGNMPQGLVEIRNHLCDDLRIPPNDLPFAAELMAVAPESREWEASIEQVLRGFAKDLLVPDKLYAKVSGYIDQTRLRDGRGRGQQLSYTRVTQHTREAPKRTSDATLCEMLKFREENPLAPWVRGEILRRFDFLACQTVEEFQRANRPAMTINRHTKRSVRQHSKDDRSSDGQRRHFVLGWDNREKRLALQSTIEASETRLSRMEEGESSLQQTVDSCIRVIGQLEQIGETKDFGSIDEFRHAHQAQQMRLERERLLQSNDRIKELKATIKSTKAAMSKRKISRDEMTERRTNMKRDLKFGDAECQKCESSLRTADEAGKLALAQEQFDSISELLQETPLSVENHLTLPSEFQQERVDEVRELEDDLEPIRKRTTIAIGKFLGDFPEYRSDMTNDVESLPQFEALEQQIRQDDLPQHEERFKARLNNNVLTEIGVLNSHLEDEREEIKRKIEEINDSLRRMEWRKDTFIRLEPDDSRNPEIRDFRTELAGCLVGYLSGEIETNEETFLKIEKLVNKLRDDKNIRWREKVIDVRNWFTFSAQELNDKTGEPGSYYDGGTGQSGGEKARLAFLVLVAAIVYQYDVQADDSESNKFHFVMVDEMFSRTDDPYARYALDLFRQFGLQLLIVAPLDAKARVCEPYVGLHAHVVKDVRTNRSELLSYTTEQYNNLNKETLSADVKNQQPS